MRHLSMLTILLLLLPACDQVCENDTDGTNVVTEGPGMTTGFNDDETNNLPTEGYQEPPPRTCVPWWSNKVACGTICVDSLGVELNAVCERTSTWECTLFWRDSPIIGENYKEGVDPPWCGPYAGK